MIPPTGYQHPTRHFVEESPRPPDVDQSIDRRKALTRRKGLIEAVHVGVVPWRRIFPSNVVIVVVMECHDGSHGCCQKGTGRGRARMQHGPIDVECRQHDIDRVPYPRSQTPRLFEEANGMSCLLRVLFICIASCRVHDAIVELFKVPFCFFSPLPGNVGMGRWFHENASIVSCRIHGPFRNEWRWT